MSELAISDSADRGRLFRRLNRRNRLVALLRIIVPICGLVLCAVLVGYVYLANVVQDFGAKGIAIDRDKLVIATPRYEGVTSDGTRYLVTAESASSKLSDPELLSLGKAILDMTRSDGYSMHATTDLARYDLGNQTVDIPGEMVVTDAHGMTAYLSGSRLDWSTQTLTSENDVRVEYADGTTILAKSLFYYGETNEWVFDKAVVSSGDGADELVPVTEEDLEF